MEVSGRSLRRLCVLCGFEWLVHTDLPYDSRFLARGVIFELWGAEKIGAFDVKTKSERAADMLSTLQRAEDLGVLHGHTAVRIVGRLEFACGQLCGGCA